jgi:four helix bundle protein
MANEVKDRSFQLAVRIVNLCQYLNDDKKEYILSKQLLKSGTSIGANVRESLNGESKLDFIHKLSIAQKEADETLFWLELLKETNKINTKEFDSIYPEVERVLKLIRSIILSTKSN